MTADELADFADLEQAGESAVDLRVGRLVTMDVVPVHAGGGVSGNVEGEGHALARPDLPQHVVAVAAPDHHGDREGEGGAQGGPTYGDGVSLCNTAHPLVSGGTNSNTFSSGADLNETSLEAAVIQIGGWTDERGLLIAAKARKLVVPRALQFVATRLLETELRVGTNDNDINALKNNGSIPEGFAINHFLTDPNAWFLTTDVPNGMKHFVRTPLSNSMDGDFDTGNVRYKSRERYSFGWSDPLGMYGSAGA